MIGTEWARHRPSNLGILCVAKIKNVPRTLMRPLDFDSLSQLWLNQNLRSR